MEVLIESNPVIFASLLNSGRCEPPAAATSPSRDDAAATAAAVCGKDFLVILAKTKLNNLKGLKKIG